MPKVTILHPRLDIPFKGMGEAPVERGPIIPLRVHWHNFSRQLEVFHREEGHDVESIELPMWKFTQEFVREKASECDRLYMPHKQRMNFDVGENVMYWMQTVFPSYFTVDKNGWGANLSFAPLKVNIERCMFEQGYREKIENFFETLKKRLSSNESKFEQPPRVSTKAQFDILFVCQIPHDETILYHSKISVMEALMRTIRHAQAKGLRVLVKGHPANPSSMAGLKQLTEEFLQTATFTMNISIHDALANCKAVAMVNSGVGFEAMLHDKPIYTFGRSEYQNVVCHDVPVDGLCRHDLLEYKMFLYDFLEENCLNTQNKDQFYQNARRICHL